MGEYTWADITKTIAGVGGLPDAPEHIGYYVPIHSALPRKTNIMDLTLEKTQFSVFDLPSQSHKLFI